MNNINKIIDIDNKDNKDNNVNIINDVSNVNNENFNYFNYKLKKINELYYENIIYNIYNISKTDSFDYFNSYMHENIIKFNNEQDNCKYIDLTNNIFYNIISSKTKKFKCIKTNKYYEIFKIILSYKDAPILLFFCNRNDPFCIVQLSNYMDIYFMIYLNDKYIVEISTSTAGHNYYLNEIMSLLNIIKKNNILDNFDKNKLINSNFDNINLFYGFNINIGHSLWNELSGLYYFLNNNINKINTIIIGPYDHFNIKKYLIDNTNYKIINFNDIFGSINYGCIININIFPIFMNHYYLDNNIGKYFFNITNNITNNICRDYIEITFEIRTNRRILKNHDKFIKFIIFKLLDDEIFLNHKFKINFCGRFFTNCNPFCIDDIEYQQQNNLVNDIINDIKNDIKMTKNYERINFNNFIGYDIFDIFTKIINTHISIAIAGTSISNLMNWIFKINILVIGPLESYRWQDIQFNILKNYNCNFIPKEFIMESNGLQGDFDIDYNLFYPYFKDKLLSFIFNE